MTRKVLLKDGMLYDSSRVLATLGDILLEDGKIKAILRSGSPQGDIVPDEVIDLSGKWVFPGFVDMHVHLRTPGQEYKEDLSSGLTAAARGGFTKVLAMPNTSPAIDDASIVRSLHSEALMVKGAKLLIAAAMTLGRKGQELCEYDELREAGAICVTDDGSWVHDGAVMRRVVDYAAACNLLPLSHPEDTTLSKGGQMNEGGISTKLGLTPIPAQAEEVAIYRDISIAALTGKPLHLCHVSTGEGVDLVRRAKRDGINVSCETAPHYLFLTEEDLVGYNTSAKINPPLRRWYDVKALREALRDGVIDVIASDHAPHSSLEKEVEFNLALFGAIGLETMVALTIKVARELNLPPWKIADFLSINPSRLLKLPVGLKVGNPADITVVDPDLNWTYHSSEGLSKSHNSPFEGWKFTGRAILTIVDGEIRSDLRA
ncbi:MAG: dihydroorotase [Deltaproteobacteria bacterium]|jgi:dihydroorotase|nr:dihydroorotase [Deltaproteobacteria bacterium]